jgi:methyl-accepting chemotaxis protein
MTEEQMQNTMQFIIEHQARFAADMEAMQEHSRQTDDRIRTLTDALLSLARITEENARQAEENVRQAEENAKQARERFRETDAKIARLAEAGEATEARLNAFISFVEKYIAGRNGGKS